MVGLAACPLDRIDDAVLFLFRHLVEEWKDEACLRRAVRVRQTVLPSCRPIGRLAMNDHDGAPRGDILLEQILHDAVALGLTAIDDAQHVGLTVVLTVGGYRRALKPR
jgi:hypothetical protein